MTIDELKSALVEVRELCKKGKCVTCPLHKTSEESGLPYCPMYENGEGYEVQFPLCWDIEDWKEKNDENANGNR